MDSELGKAVIAWVNTFPNLSRRCEELEDCADGGLFYEILSEIDGQWFKLFRSIDTGDNWVLKFNNLKKLYKLLTGFYEEVLGQNTSQLDVPNLTAIAKDADAKELLKLAQLIVALAVQCEQNQRYIVKIQSLDQVSQHALMLAIEQVMSRLAATGSRDAPENYSNDTPLTSPIHDKEKDELEAMVKILKEQLQALQFKYDDLVSEKKDLQTGLMDMEQSMSELSGAAKIDFILRNEIDSLKSELEKSENKRVEAESVVEKQASIIKELSKKTDDAIAKAEDAGRLKDQLDEFRHVADRLQKSEAMIEKYKKKMEESSDIRRQMKLLEGQTLQLSDRNRYLEEEYRKISGLKPLMDTYKEQISSLEAKHSVVQVENSKLEFELKEAKNKLERIDLQRKNDLEHIQSLEDQVRDMELNISAQVSGASLSAEGIESLNTEYRTRIAQLEQQIERSRSGTDEESRRRIIELEAQLDEAIRLKQKFETDYLHAFQKHLALENEVRQLRSISQSDEQPHAESLRVTLKECQEELTVAKRKLMEYETSMGQNSPSGIVPASPDYERVKRQLDSLEKESRLHMGQINKLLKEKDVLESQTMELRDSLLQQERANSDLKAALAALESRGQSSDETTQKLAALTQKTVQLTEQNTKLHKALKEAKKHILSQDKQIKDHKAIIPKDNFVEAITSYEAMTREKDAEIERLLLELSDTRRAARREQQLMVSAWYDITLNQQKRAIGSRTDGTPSTWLAQQRRALSFKGR